MNPHGRWDATWRHLDRRPPVGLIDELVAAYRQRHRAYHTLQHLAECFQHLDRSPVRPLDAGALELALWFHDSIYDPKAVDNEAKSAAWARESLQPLDAPTLDRIENLILVTRHDAAPDTADEELLLDVDLSILGAAPARFAEYEAQVRQEYDWVPVDAYRTARARILREFEARPALYRTEHFRRTLEAQARINLRRSLESLGAL